MSTLDEKKAVEQVCEGLSERFPTVDRAAVRALVDEIYAAITGPIRDYVPLLVERAARERLQSLAESAEHGRSLGRSGALTG